MSTTTVNRTFATAVGIAALGASLALAAPSSAQGSSHSGGTRVVDRGSCSVTGTYKLTAKHDDNLIEIEYEVDTNVAGQTFTVRIGDNGQNVVARKPTTHGASGSFTVHARIADRAGTDTITAHARHAGNRCGGTVTL